MKVAIASGKGGTGKTSLSVNWVTYLGKLLIGNVILVDLDVEEPNSGLFLKGNLIFEEDAFVKVPKWNADACTFCNKCQSVCNFNAIASLPNTVLIFSDLCHSCFACSELCPEQALPMTDHKIGVMRKYQVEENVFLIEGVLDVGKETAVPLIKQTLQGAQKGFHKEDLFIYDAPPGTACSMIESVKDADFVVLITEPTPFGFHDLKLAIETVRQLGKNFGVVINRDGIGNSEVEDYCREEHIEVLAKIPQMLEVAQLYSKGELFYDVIPEVKSALKGLSENILKELYHG